MALFTNSEAKLALSRLLNCEPANRMAAAQALKKIGTKGIPLAELRKAFEVMIPFLCHADESVRKGTKAALSSLGIELALVAAELIDTLSAWAGQLTTTDLDHLLSIRQYNWPAHVAITAVIVHHPESALRLKVIRSLTYDTLAFQWAQSAIETAASDPDEQIQEAAIKTLTQMKADAAKLDAESEAAKQKEEDAERRAHEQRVAEHLEDRIRKLQAVAQSLFDEGNMTGYEQAMKQLDELRRMERSAEIL